MTNKKTILSVGLNDKNEHKQIITNTEAVDIITRSIASVRNRGRNYYRGRNRNIQKWGWEND
jgi:hypothetical protein